MIFLVSTSFLILKYVNIILAFPYSGMDKTFFVIFSLLAEIYASQKTSFLCDNVSQLIFFCHKNISGNLF